MIYVKANRRNIMSDAPRQRSNWWYILSIFISPIGGIIAYFAIRHDDPKKAKNCLIIGFIIFGIGVVSGVVSTTYLSI